MTEEQRELFFDLLAKKAVYGLDEADDNQLAEFDRGAVDAEFCSLEMTAAAIGLAGVQDIEPMPEHLRATILKNAPHGADIREEHGAKIYDSSDVFGEKRSSWFSWLGWAAAAAACVALAFNIWFTRFQPTEQVNLPNPPQTPQALTDRQKHDELMASAGVIKANWAAGNVKDINVTGDVVWSDEEQTGYMRLRGLPVKGPPEFCYQLWIFDKTQDKATPIDGGTFDVNEDGEIIIPITAKIRPNTPLMFAITIERHGGVVVSKREQIAALAKVETQSS
jgi:anti-sigma-K factor RskA